MRMYSAFLERKLRKNSATIPLMLQ